MDDVSEQALKDAADVMRALQFEQDGKTLATPIGGKYRIVMRKGMTFFGDANKVAALLGKAFPGSEFTWA